MEEVLESDWKLFRERIKKWQEMYIERLNKKYAEILNSKGKASENFWKVEELINEDKKHPGVTIELRRSNMRRNMVILYRDGVINDADLNGFSEDFKKDLKKVSAFLG